MSDTQQLPVEVQPDNILGVQDAPIDINNVTVQGIIPSTSVTDAYEGDPEIDTRMNEAQGAIMGFANLSGDIGDKSLRLPLEKIEASEFIGAISGTGTTYAYQHFAGVVSHLYPNMPANPNKINDIKYTLKKMRDLQNDISKMEEAFRAGERTPSFTQRLTQMKSQYVDPQTVIDALPVGPTRKYFMEKMDVIKQQYGINTPQMIKAALDGVTAAAATELAGTGLGLAVGLPAGGVGALATGPTAAVATAPFAVKAGEAAFTYSLGEQIYKQEAASTFFELYMMNQESQYPMSEENMQELSRISGAFTSVLEMIDVNTGAEKDVKDSILSILKNPLGKKTYAKLLMELGGSLAKEEFFEIGTEEAQQLVNWVINDTANELTSNPDAQGDESMARKFVTHLDSILSASNWRGRLKEMAHIAEDTAWGVLGQSGPMLLSTKLGKRVWQDITDKRTPLNREERQTLNDLPDMAGIFVDPNNTDRVFTPKNISNEDVNKHGAILADVLMKSPKMAGYLSPGQITVLTEFMNRNKKDAEMSSYFFRRTGYTISELEAASEMIIVNTKEREARVVRAEGMLAAMVPELRIDGEFSYVALDKNEALDSSVKGAEVKVTSDDNNSTILIEAKTEDGSAQYSYKANEDGSLQIVNIKASGLDNVEVADIATKLLKINLAEESAIVMTPVEKQAFDTLMKFKRKKRETISTKDIEEHNKAITVIEELQKKLATNKTESDGLYKKLRTIQYKARHQYSDSTQLRPEDVQVYTGERFYPPVPVDESLAKSEDDIVIDDLFNDFYTILKDPTISDDMSTEVTRAIIELENFVKMRSELERYKSGEYTEEKSKLFTGENENTSDAFVDSRDAVERNEYLNEIRIKIETYKNKLSTRRKEVDGIVGQNRSNLSKEQEKTLAAFQDYERRVNKLIEREIAAIDLVEKDTNTFKTHEEDKLSHKTFVDELLSIDVALQGAIEYMARLRKYINEINNIDIQSFNEVARDKRMQLLDRYVSLRDEVLTKRETAYRRRLSSIRHGKLEGFNAFPFEDLLSELDNRINAIASDEIDSVRTTANLTGDYKAATRSNTAFILYNETVLNDLFRLHEKRRTVDSSDYYKDVASNANRYRHELNGLTRKYFGEREISASDIAKLIEDTISIAGANYMTHVAGQSPSTLAIPVKDLLTELNPTTKTKESAVIEKKPWPKAISSSFASLKDTFDKDKELLKQGIATLELLITDARDAKHIIDNNWAPGMSVADQVNYVEGWFEYPFMIEEIHEDALELARKLMGYYAETTTLANKLEDINTAYRHNTGYPVHDLSDINIILDQVTNLYNNVIGSVPPIIENRDKIELRLYDEAKERKEELLLSNIEAERIERLEARKKALEVREEGLPTLDELVDRQDTLEDDGDYKDLDYEEDLSIVDTQHIDPIAYIEQLGILEAPKYTKLDEKRILKANITNRAKNKMATEISKFEQLIADGHDKEAVMKRLKGELRTFAKKVGKYYKSKLSDTYTEAEKDALGYWMQSVTSIDGAFQAGLFDKSQYTSLLSMIQSLDIDSLDPEGRAAKYTEQVAEVIGLGTTMMQEHAETVTPETISEKKDFAVKHNSPFDKRVFFERKKAADIAEEILAQIKGTMSGELSQGYLATYANRVYNAGLLSNRALEVARGLIYQLDNLYEDKELESIALDTIRSFIDSMVKEVAMFRDLDVLWGRYENKEIKDTVDERKSLLNEFDTYMQLHRIDNEDKAAALTYIDMISRDIEKARVLEIVAFTEELENLVRDYTLEAAKSNDPLVNNLIALSFHAKFNEMFYAEITKENNIEVERQIREKTVEGTPIRDVYDNVAIKALEFYTRPELAPFTVPKYNSNIVRSAYSDHYKAILNLADYYKQHGVITTNQFSKIRKKLMTKNKFFYSSDGTRKYYDVLNGAKAAGGDRADYRQAYNDAVAHFKSVEDLIAYSLDSSKMGELEAKEKEALNKAIEVSEAGDIDERLSKMMDRIVNVERYNLNKNVPDSETITTSYVQMEGIAKEFKRLKSSLNEIELTQGEHSLMNNKSKEYLDRRLEAETQINNLINEMLGIYSQVEASGIKYKSVNDEMAFRFNQVPFDLSKHQALLNTISDIMGAIGGRVPDIVNLESSSPFFNHEEIREEDKKILDISKKKLFSIDKKESKNIAFLRTLEDAKNGIPTRVKERATPDKLPEVYKTSDDARENAEGVYQKLTDEWDKARAIITSRAILSETNVEAEIDKLDKIRYDLSSLAYSPLSDEEVQKRTDKLYDDYRELYHALSGIQWGDLEFSSPQSYVVEYKKKTATPTAHTIVKAPLYQSLYEKHQAIKEDIAPLKQFLKDIKDNLDKDAIASFEKMMQDIEATENMAERYKIKKMYLDTFAATYGYDKEAGTLSFQKELPIEEAEKIAKSLSRDNPYTAEYEALVAKMQEAVATNQKAIDSGLTPPIDMAHYRTLIEAYQKRLELYGVEYDPVIFGDEADYSKQTDLIPSKKIQVSKKKKRGYVTKSDTVLPLYKDWHDLKRGVINAERIMRGQTQNVAGRLSASEAEEIMRLTRQLGIIKNDAFVFEGDEHIQQINQTLDRYNAIAKRFNDIFTDKLKSIRIREEELVNEMLFDYELAPEDRADVLQYIESLSTLSQDSVKLRDRLLDIQNKIEGPDNIQETTYEYDESGARVESGTKNIRVRKNHWRRIRTEAVNTHLSQVMVMWNEIYTKISELQRKGAEHNAVAPYREMLAELMNMAYNTLEFSKINMKDVSKLKDQMIFNFLDFNYRSDAKLNKNSLYSFVDIMSDVLQSIKNQADITATLTSEATLGKKQRLIKKKVYQHNITRQNTKIAQIKSVQDAQAARVGNVLEEARMYQKAVNESSGEMISMLMRLYDSINLIENREEIIRISALAGLYTDPNLRATGGIDPDTYKSLRYDIELDKLNKLSFKELSNYYKLVLEVAKRDAAMLSMQLEDETDLGYRDLARLVADDIKKNSAVADPDTQRERFRDLKDLFDMAHGYNLLVEKISGRGSLVYKLLFSDPHRGQQLADAYVNEIDTAYAQDMENARIADKKAYFSEVVGKIGKFNVTKEFLLTMKQNRRVADNWAKIKENTLFFDDGIHRSRKFTNQEKNQLIEMVDGYRLTEQDETVLKAFQNYMDKLYYLANERYVDIYGKELPRNNFYIPLFHTTEYSAVGTELMRESNNVENNILSTFAVGMIREKKKTNAPVKITSMGNYLRYASHNASKFYFMQKELIRANAVLTSGAVANAIRGHISEDYYNLLLKGLKRWGGNYEAMTNMDKFIARAAKTFTQGIVFGNGFIAMMQSFSIWTNIYTGAPHIVRAIFDATINPKKIDMILNDNSYYRNRAKRGGQDALAYLDQIYGGRDFTTGQSRWHKMNTWMTRNVDKHTIRIGMYAAFNEFLDNVERGYFKEEIKNLMDIDDRAIEFLRSDVNMRKQVALEYAEMTQRNTQPQTDTQFRSELQSEPKFKFLTMFGSFVQAMNDLQSRTLHAMKRGEKGATLAYVKTLASLYIAMPMLSGLLDVGRGKFFNWIEGGEDDDDPFWQLFLENYLLRASTGYFFGIKDVVPDIYRYIRGEAGVDLGMPNPIIDVINTMLWTGKSLVIALSYGMESPRGAAAMKQGIKGMLKMASLTGFVGYQPLWIINGIIQTAIE